MFIIFNIPSPEALYSIISAIHVKDDGLYVNIPQVSHVEHR